MKSTTAIQLLAERGWLSFTPAEFRNSVLERIRVREFAKGSAIFRAGDAPGGPWVIMKGAVRIEMPYAGAAPHLIHYAASGFWFGEWPLILRNSRLVTAIATRQSTLGTLPLDDCHAILEAHPGAWQWIAFLSAMTTDLAMGVATDSLLRDPSQRTAALLLRLAGVRSTVFVSKLPVSIQLTQEELGRLVNLSRNSVTPILREFVERGLVELGYGSIRISDVAGLTARANNTTRL